MRLPSALCAAGIVAASTLLLAGVAHPAQDSTGSLVTPAPIWAWPITPPAPSTGPKAPQDMTPRRPPHSTAPGMAQSVINDINVVPDWFPDQHPKMPPIVSVGRPPEISPCGHCHLPTGYGRPENASLNGLPKSYFLEQLDDFRTGARKSTQPGMHSIGLMVAYTKVMTPEEENAAADYFASVKPVKWIRVVEADTIPKVHAQSLMMVVDPGNETEPIGDRVIEVSEDYEQTELRNPTSGFVAYVPKGSLKRGEDLVRNGGGGKTMACTTCHGANLKGTGDIPSIAGRSPSQMIRQLIDFQNGVRNGKNGQMMKMQVAKLTISDMVAITGYLASLEP